MKQKDIALILVISFMSALISVFISNALISPPKNRKEQVEVVDVISPIFPEADKKYFNANSLNPTETISIGEDPNLTPFDKLDKQKQ